MDYGPSSNLQSVSPSVVQDITNFSGLKFLGVSDPIDGCVGRTVGQTTVRRYHRWLHLQIFFYSLFLVCFGYKVLHYLPIGIIRPRIKTKLAEIEGELRTSLLNTEN